MCDNELKSMLRTSNISIATIQYLTQSTIINDVSNTLFNDVNNFSLSEIQDPSNREQFKLDIREHFEWISKHCIDSTTNFNEYNDGYFFDAYEFFYEKAIEYIDQENIAEEVKNNLINYFLHIQK